jgi:hypothetical protein
VSQKQLLVTDILYTAGEMTMPERPFSGVAPGDNHSSIQRVVYEYHLHSFSQHPPLVSDKVISRTCHTLLYQPAIFISIVSSTPISAGLPADFFQSAHINLLLIVSTSEYPLNVNPALHNKCLLCICFICNIFVFKPIGLRYQLKIALMLSFGTGPDLIRDTMTVQALHVIDKSADETGLKRLSFEVATT